MVFEQNEESVDYDQENPYEDSSSEDTSMNDGIESAASSEQSLNIINAAIAKNTESDRRSFKQSSSKERSASFNKSFERFMDEERKGSSYLIRSQTEINKQKDFDQ